MLKNTTPGDPNCRAVKLNDSTLDTHLLRNRSGIMILSAGRPDWRLPSGPQALTISIDGEAPVGFTGYPVDRIVLVQVTDPALEKKLKAATMLKWHTPWGDFSADVTGLGVAFDAIPVCPE